MQRHTDHTLPAQIASNHDPRRWAAMKTAETRQGHATQLVADVLCTGENIREPSGRHVTPVSVTIKPR
jgi:hypothetical protein